MFVQKYILSPIFNALSHLQSIFSEAERPRQSVFTLKVKHCRAIKNCQIFSKLESSMNDYVNNPS